MEMIGRYADCRAKSLRFKCTMHFLMFIMMLVSCFIINPFHELLSSIEISKYRISLLNVEFLGIILYYAHVETRIIII